MQRIAIYNKKGGIGKSTLSVNISHGLAKIGYKTLLIDLDAQQDSTDNLGFNEDDFECTFYDLLKNDDLPKESYILEARENLHLITNSQFKKINDVLQAEARIDLILDELFSGIQNDYDYIFLDCSPTESKINDAILLYVDHIIIPVQLEYNSVRGVGNIYDYLSDLRIKPDIIKLVIPNMLDLRKKDNKEHLEFLHEMFNDKQIVTEAIPDRSKLPLAAKHGETIWEMGDYELESVFVNVIRKVVEVIGS